jgi:ATP-dependent DNA helicase RecG
MTQHELEVICRNGEGQEVEFKRNINSDFSKELVAFANAKGGRIFIGIDDGGNVVGVDIDNELKSRVEMVGRDCDPAVPIRLEVFDNILIVEVPEGKDKPYRCTNVTPKKVG